MGSSRPNQAPNQVPYDVAERGADIPSARFAIGSTLGDVLAAQGRPSHADGDIWYYGKSTVTFVQGRVASWSQHPEYPLRTSATHPPDSSELAFYGLGASSEMVLAIQGPPSRIDGNTWHYGSSKIHFSGDRVSAWEESPLSPLRIRP